jgi:hypothetical protein
MTTDLPAEVTDGLVRICRTATGDSLRSVIYFTPADFDVLYLRSDLDETADTRETIERFVDSERLGFDSQEQYQGFPTEPAIGEYGYTLRVFSDGFLSRVIVGDHGVLLTTDGQNIDNFKVVAVALRLLLAEYE